MFNFSNNKGNAEKMKQLPIGVILTIFSFQNIIELLEISSKLSTKLKNQIVESSVLDQQLPLKIKLHKTLPLR